MLLRSSGHFEKTEWASICKQNGRELLIGKGILQIMLKQYLEVGEIVTTHGVIGEVKIYPWVDDPAVFRRFKQLFWDGAGIKPVKVLGVKLTGNMPVVRLEGTDTVEAGRRLVGKLLYADRKSIPLAKGRHFVQDIIGCQVFDDVTGQCYGKVTDVTHPANCDIYTVATPEGNQVFFPAVEEFMGSVDVEAGKITVKPIEGMFTDAD